MPAPFYFWDEWDIDNNYARKSDLLRLQVLYNYGGVYLDTDMECIKPIDNLLNGYNFVVASECGFPWKLDCSETHLNNAFIASTQKNTVVRNIMLKVKEKYKKLEIDDNSKPLEYVSQVGGPDVLNELRRKFEKIDGVKIYPSRYFYPIHYSEKIKMKNWQIPTNPATQDKDTHMIHHFAASWYKQK
tara:strand:- start:334 stop:894 length:561 start_codon:yes stop_codon:yes gene_type:complete